MTKAANSATAGSRRAAYETTSATTGTTIQTAARCKCASVIVGVTPTAASAGANVIRYPRSNTVITRTATRAA